MDQIHAPFPHHPPFPSLADVPASQKGPQCRLLSLYLHPLFYCVEKILTV